MKFAFFIMFCLIILLFLYIINRKKIKSFFGQKNSKYYFCWILMLLSNLAFPKTIQYATRILSLLFTWLVVLFSTRGTQKRLNISVLSFILLMNIFWYFISTIYSISKFETFMKCIEVFTDYILISLISLEDKKRFVVNTLNVTIQTIFVTVLITVIGFFIIPSYFTENGYTILHSLLGTRLSNGFLGANKTSALSVLCIMWLFFSKKKINKYDIFMFIICSIAMFYSQSRTTLLLIPIIVFLRFFKPKSKYKFLYFIMVSLLLFFCISNIHQIETYLLRGQSQEMLKSGTGRTEMWKIADYYISENPILGYGYGVGGEIVSEKYFNITSMHSAVYETLLGTGYIGLIVLLLLFLLVLLTVVRNILKYKLKNNLYDILLIAFFLVRSISGTGIASWHSMETMLWFFVIFAFSDGSKTIQMYYNEQ